MKEDQAFFTFVDGITFVVDALLLLMHYPHKEGDCRVVLGPWSLVLVHCSSSHRFVDGSPQVIGAGIGGLTCAALLAQVGTIILGFPYKEAM